MNNCFLSFPDQCPRCNSRWVNTAKDGYSLTCSICPYVNVNGHLFLWVQLTKLRMSLRTNIFTITTSNQYIPTTKRYLDSRDSVVVYHRDHLLPRSIISPVDPLIFLNASSNDELNDLVKSFLIFS
jgi:hypothetical protein